VIIMLGFLKRLFTRRLSHDVWIVDRDAAGRLRQVKCTAVGSIGLSLLVHNDKGEQLIQVQRCSDPHHYWKLWRHYNPEVKLTWSDGTPTDFV